MKVRATDLRGWGKDGWVTGVLNQKKKTLLGVFGSHIPDPASESNADWFQLDCVRLIQ